MPTNVIGQNTSSDEDEWVMVPRINPVQYTMSTNSIVVIIEYLLPHYLNCFSQPLLCRTRVSRTVQEYSARNQTMQMTKENKVC